MHVFNDLIILRQIVPTLTTETLRSLLKEVKLIDKFLNNVQRDSTNSDSSDNSDGISLKAII